MSLDIKLLEVSIISEHKIIEVIKKTLGLYRKKKDDVFSHEYQGEQTFQ